jgi:hypothetical protein
MSDKTAIREHELRERLRVFYDPFIVDMWLVAPQPLLGGRSARQLIDEGKIDEVERIVAQLEDGVFL